jgi:hypothetical protein
MPQRCLIKDGINHPNDRRIVIEFITQALREAFLQKPRETLSKLRAADNSGGCCALIAQPELLKNLWLGSHLGTKSCVLGV